MKWYIYIFILIILTISVNAQNNIYQFDERGDIILTTSVYKDGVPYNDSDCNLTVFFPPPNENFINFSVIMENKGNGIYSYDLTELIEYNDQIYPITLYCNDSTGFNGHDDRVGIKIGVKLYDYIIPGIILIFIAFIFVYISFKFNEKLQDLKLLTLYMGLLFVIASLFYGLSVVNNIPTNTGLKVIFTVLISVFMVLLSLLVYLQFTDKIDSAVNYMLGGK